MTQPIHPALTALSKQGVITRGEQQALARLNVLAKADQPTDSMLVAFSLAFRSPRTGDVCVDLANPNVTELPVGLPAVAQLVSALQQSPLVSRPNDPDISPFVLDDTRLYLRRAYEQEQALVSYITQQAARTTGIDETWLATALTDLYGPPATDGVNRQRLASAISMLRNLVVIAGGPGSGKTYTVGRILTLLDAWQAAQQQPALNVVLAAPTGRAAARLSATLAAAGITTVTPAMTLHRLLYRHLSDRSQATIGQQPSLDADVVILDEASMVGLPLFATLVTALKPSARLIVLGDSNQLGAIDTGAVFHELCGPQHQDDALGFSQTAAEQYRRVTGEAVIGVSGDNTQGLRDVIVRFNVTHRFDDAGAVGQAAELLRDTVRATSTIITDLTTLTQSASGFRLIDGSQSDVDIATAKQALIDTAVEAYNAATNAIVYDADPQLALTRFDAFRLLCAIHDGPYGTRQFNQQIVAELARINPRFRANDRFSPGRFVLVTRNDPRAGIQNGDVGVVVDTGRNGQVQVAFAPGSDSINLVSPYRLYEPDDPYAMSVHKAQGSQFTTVALVLPDTPTAVATRSLVYTAVTRAVTNATILDPAGTLKLALERIEARISGLSASLFNPSSGP